LFSTSEHLRNKIVENGPIGLFKNSDFVNVNAPYSQQHNTNSCVGVENTKTPLFTPFSLFSTTQQMPRGILRCINRMPLTSLLYDVGYAYSPTLQAYERVQWYVFLGSAALLAGAGYYVYTHPDMNSPALPRVPDL
jgi:hypothetical protein